MTAKTYHISFRCYYVEGNYTQHYADITLAEIKKWVEAYKYTHPACSAISIRVIFEA